MNLSSESPYRLSFNKELYKILFHDLYVKLSNTDFERRFYKFHIETMREVHKELQGVLPVKNLFDFPYLETTKVAQILEIVFQLTVKSLKTFSINEFQQKEKRLYTLFTFIEEEMAKFELVGSKVDAYDYFSDSFLEAQIKLMFDCIYADMFIRKSQEQLLGYQEQEIKEEMTEFYIQQVKEFFIWSEEETPNINYLKNEILSKKKEFFQIESLSQVVGNLIQLIQERFPEKSDNANLWLRKFENERIGVALYSFLSNKTELAVEEEITLYTTKYRSSFSKILNSFLASLEECTYLIDWYVPCFPGYFPQESWPVNTPISLLKKSQVEQVFQENGSFLNTLKKNEIEMFVHFQRGAGNRDTQLALYQFQSYLNDILNIFHFQEEYPIPFKVKWYEGIYQISNVQTKKKTYGQNGREASFQPPLDEKSMRKKADFHAYFLVVQEKVSSNHPLLQRLSQSMELYRQHLEMSSLENKLLKLWNILELLTQQDNFKKISQMASFFPGIYTNDLYPQERIKQMEKKEQVHFFQQQKKMYEDILSELGKIRNEYVAHKNRGKSIQEWRFKRNVNILRKIVIKVQRTILMYLESDLSIISLKDIVTALKKEHYGN